MQVELTEAEERAWAGFRQFVEREVVPHADQFDHEGSIPRSLLSKLAVQGYFGANVSKQYGGVELGAVGFGLLCHELGRASASLLSVFTVHSIVCSVLERWGTRSQRECYLPRLARGELLAAFALSEPNVGSDAAAVETHAVLDGNDYLLVGQKTWTSAGAVADLFLVFASLDATPAAFLVERGSQGLNTTPIRGMFGFQSALLAEVQLQGCPVPTENLVGRPGFGFSHVATSALDHGRYCIAWGAVGLGQACLEASTRYASQRKQFGVPLGDHQLVRRMLADMYTDNTAARMLCYRAGYLREEAAAESIIETSTAKYFASRAAVRAALDAVHVHGANGCSNAYPVARYLRDAKVFEIIEGSNEMQQLLLGQHALRKFS